MADEPAVPPVPPAAPVAPTPPVEPAAPDGLGDAGKRALQAERDARAAAERSSKDLQARIDALETANLNEVDRLVKDESTKAADAVRAEMNSERVGDKIALAAAGKLVDPTVAAPLLGDLSRFVVDGSIDTAAITAAVDQLVTDKPFLAAGGAPPVPPVPGGPRTPDAPGQTFEQQMAAAQAIADPRERNKAVMRLNGQRLGQLQTTQK